MVLSTITHPGVPGEYPIAVTFQNGATIIGRRTIYLTINPYVLTGLSLFRLSRDKVVGGYHILLNRIGLPYLLFRLTLLPICQAHNFRLIILQHIVNFR